jgi:FkbM family methyltransferase
MRSSEELAADVPVYRDVRFRIEMTVGCQDCSGLPKVPHAGEIVVENGEPVQIMHNGVRVVAGGYYGAWMSEIITRLRGHHEPQEEVAFDAVMRCLPEHATMIEVGGFWSYYSLWFLQGHPHRRAIVIEADPNHLEIGRRNARLNNAAVNFFAGFAGAESREQVPFQTETAGTIALPMINIARFIEERGIATLDILHCDAQGAEVDVVANCEELFRQGRVRFLVLSTHAAAITGDTLTHQRCLDALIATGGRILIEHDVHESFSGDGLIVCHFGTDLPDWPLPAISRNRYSTALFRSPLYDLCIAARGQR